MSRKKAEAERRKNLALLSPQVERFVQDSLYQSWQADHGAYTPLGPIDMFLTHRGQCSGCNECPGYGMPPHMVSPQHLLRVCAHCGCDAEKHEDLGKKRSESPH